MVRAVRVSPVFARETITTVQYVGGALMALTVGGELVCSNLPVFHGLQGVFLFLLGIPGVLTWLIGTVAALAAFAARPADARRPRSSSGEPILATLAYEEWSESPSAPVEVEAKH
jgi:hypothetical protein